MNAIFVNADWKKYMHEDHAEIWKEEGDSKNYEVRFEISSLDKDQLQFLSSIPEVSEVLIRNGVNLNNYSYLIIWS